MKTGTSRHPKLMAFARTLGISRPLAVGTLELLWEFTATYAPDGAIGRFSNEEIAEVVDWTGDPEALIAALTAAGSRWLDRCDKHRLIVHDWADHAPDYIKKRASRGQFSLIFGPVQTTADTVQTSADNGGHCPDIGGQRQTTADIVRPPNPTQPNPTQPMYTRVHAKETANDYTPREKQVVAAAYFYLRGYEPPADRIEDAE